MDWQRADRVITSHLGSALIVALVAISAFMLGSQYSNSATDVAEGGNTEESFKPTTESSTIQQLQQLISNPSTQEAATGQTSTTQPAGLISINSASQAELETLPGIGPSKAKAIIDYRLKNGPFVTIEGLDAVSGIGPKTLEDLRPFISI